MKDLKDDFDFFEIINDEELNFIEVNIDKELTRRYQLLIDDPSGKDWEVLRQEIYPNISVLAPPR